MDPFEKDSEGQNVLQLFCEYIDDEKSPLV